MSKKTLEIVKATGNEAILQVKGNQGYLLFDCEEMTKNKPDEIHTQQSNKKVRNREETRIAKTFTQLNFIHKKRWNGLIQMVIQVERKRKEFNTKTKTWSNGHEISYYVSTKKFSAKEAGEIIRGHWGIENKNHYVKDVSMKEDASRIRKNPHIIAKLRSIGLNILRANNVRNISKELFRNAININRALKRYGKFLI